ncbi:FMT1 Methionyl-tRNA formyltransferase [Candida maltosa Xu316]|uniref:Methionyl-tRNA formyltransferase, mitochondrial n=1 Tax=Candida maltosa (strain Xu316) TaxID=1245528 RepID=M3JVY2_CANMX|nr:hypothetical protein G210_2650 [Candida maltosa Xu316]
MISLRNAFTVFKRTLVHSTHDPLKIAFFGSDTFSVASLGKLVQYQKTNPTKIDSIHTITRNLKPKGRGMKTVEDLPIGNLANSLGIPVLRADNSSEILDILKSQHFNLVIAVSYGKLIPAQFIQECKYGGLNVHPSLLPKYSGSSPLQYALLNDDKTTGCTVQTLHPTKFDHGEIIVQSDEIPINETDNLSTLFDKFGGIGSDLLVKSIDEGLFVNPVPVQNEYKYSLAPKIPKSKSQILWDQLSARQIKRMYDALGPLFTFLNVNLRKKRKVIQEKQRVILSEITESTGDEVELANPGDFVLNKDGLIIKAKDGNVIAKLVKMQAQSEESPESFIGSYNKKVGDTPKQFIN